jgi:hypothetical protein
VIEVREGRIVRDERAGLYSQASETTGEFAARMRGDTA